MDKRFGFKDLTGMTFGRLFVTGLSHIKEFPCGQKHRVWNCRCSCGAETNVVDGELKQGGTKSCGCLQREIAATVHTKHGHSPQGNPSPIYEAWCGMKKRCHNTRNADYKYYGGRGIRVCQRWMSFIEFHKDMSPTWFPGLTIERKNNNGNYTPPNCRWATRQEQAVNRRSNHMISFDGETLNLKQWADRIGVSQSAIIHRLKDGWPLEAAVTKEKGYLFKPFPSHKRGADGKYIRD